MCKRVVCEQLTSEKCKGFKVEERDVKNVKCLVRCVCDYHIPVWVSAGSLLLDHFHFSSQVTAEIL